MRRAILTPIANFLKMTEFAEAPKAESMLSLRLKGFPIQRLPDGVIQHTLSFVGEECI